MLNFLKKHQKTIIAIAAAIIVPGGLIVLAANFLKKHFNKKSSFKK